MGEGSLFSLTHAIIFKSRESNRNLLFRTLSKACKIHCQSLEMKNVLFYRHITAWVCRKQRPCSNSPEMTCRPQKTLGMLCLAALRSLFYIFVGGLRFPHTGLGVLENEDPTVIHNR